MDSWKLIISPKLSGAENMRRDIGLFNDLEAGNIPSTLRVYSWEPKCITLGYAQGMFVQQGWDVVRRPTGGGIVYHEEGEVAYSVVTAIDDPILPKGLIPSYKKISQAIVYALRKLDIKAELSAQPSAERSSLCFAQSMEYEIIANDKKIVGSAQKRGKRALLQQGAVKPGRQIHFEAMAAALAEGFENKLGIKFDV
jgi:lipoate-protein ligase A